MTIVQPIMQVHEDLASLFSRNLTLDQPPAAVQPPSEDPKITYSISQHYHHSSHIAKQNLETPQQQQRPASEPPQPEYQVTESVLLNHGVDPSMLSAAQLELFKTVDEPDKLVLIEIWRVCPPTNSDDNPTLAWGSTSVEQEKTLARMRFERQESANSAMSLDGTPVPTPMQGSDGRWMYAQSYMEPYMSPLATDQQPTQQGVGGQYHGAMYHSATDPVYRTTNLGANPGHHQQQMEMENNYGLLMAMRENDMEL